MNKILLPFALLPFYLFTFLPLHLEAQSCCAGSAAISTTPDVTCRCGDGCQCKITGDKSNCKCINCKCVVPCKCGRNCQCKINGDKSECICGPNCQCDEHNHGVHSAHLQKTSFNIFLKMMDEMMVKMEAVTLTSALERNFLLQMIPHHKGALEMAKYEIAIGTNKEMIQLAKSILVEQQTEIMKMEQMLKSYPEIDGNMNVDYKKQIDFGMEIMMQNTPLDTELTENVDCNFAKIMLPHHQAAVDMAKTILKFNPSGQVAIYAQRIISDQVIEIEIMREFIAWNCGKGLTD